MWYIHRNYCTDDGPRPWEPIGDNLEALVFIEREHTGNDFRYPTVNGTTPLRSRSEIADALTARGNLRVDLTLRGCRPSDADICWSDDGPPGDWADWPDA